jgi:hypothetical protein
MVSRLWLYWLISSRFIQEFTTRVTTITVVQCCWLSKLSFGFSYYLLCFIIWQLEEFQYNMLVVTSGDFEQDMVVMDRWIPLKLNAQVMPPLSLPLFNQLIQSIVGAFSNMFGFGIIVCNFNRCIYFLLYYCSLLIKCLMI